MAWRLDQRVTWGEIVNTTRNRVYGQLYVANQRHPLSLNLTGNCAAGLAGRHVRFVPAQPRIVWPPSRGCGLDIRQIGPAGRMEYRWEQRPDAPPCWLLELQWFGQNGRVELVLPDPQIEFLSVAVDAECWEDQYDPCPAEGLLAGQEWLTAIGIVQARSGAELASESPWESNLSQGGWQEAARRPEVAPDLFAMLQAMAEGDENVPLASLFDPPLKLPDPSQLADREVTWVLRELLARLAQHCVSFEICEHFTQRQAYQLLVQRLLPMESVYPHLAQIGCIEHFGTSEFCPTCRREFDDEPLWSEDDPQCGNLHLPPGCS